MQVLKYFGVFIGGVVVGSVITNKLVKDKYSRIAQEEIDEMQEYYSDKINHLEVKDALREHELKNMERTTIEFDEYEKDIHKQISSEYDHTLAELEHPEDDSYEEDEDEDDLEDPDPDDDPNFDRDYDEYRKISEESNRAALEASDPYIILENDFNDDMPHYDKISLCYYTEDNTLADDSEEIIKDVNYVIGSEALNEFGNGSSDPDIVYVRNEKIGADFEIVRVNSSYKEMVLGLINESISKGE